MTVLAVAVNVNDNIVAETLAVFECKLSRSNACLWVVPIDVQDGYLQKLCNATCIWCRTTVLGGCGKTDLVVDDDVYRSSGTVATKPRKVQRLLHDSLPCEGSITMNKNREYCRVRSIAELIAESTRHTLDDGVDRLEMTRIWCKNDGDVLPIWRSVDRL
ncbi:hypothetical protein HRbin20_01176 [bacterium HR20]|nr:hypothetical protein HRbin20_01176 [bacterium HR20]